jgi:hypothetical protein
MKEFEKAIKTLAIINGVFQSMKPANEWPAFINYEYLDAALRVLTDEELHNFVAGDSPEVDELIETHGLHHVNELLDYIFVGDIHCLFFNPLVNYNEF